jgi:hypothetical protein
MDQWRRWCLNPDYAVGAEGPQVREAFASVRTPITSLSFTDDEMMSARNTRSLHHHYSNAPKKMARIAPPGLRSKAFTLNSGKREAVNFLPQKGDGLLKIMMRLTILPSRTLK